MKLLVSIVALAVLSTVCLASEQQASGQQQQQQAGSVTKPVQAQQANNERQGRQISPGGTGNHLYSDGTSNTIDHSPSRRNMEMEQQAVSQLLTTKNIFKAIVKLLFGSTNEATATTRSVLSVLSVVLDNIKQKFVNRARSASTARGIRESADEVAAAGISMLQGYVKSVLATDTSCAQRYLCEATRSAIRDGRDLGYMIASVGGYATSYLLDSSKSGPEFQKYQEALRAGRDLKEQTPCEALYKCLEAASAIPKAL